MKLWHTLILALCVLLVADGLVGDRERSARLQEAGRETALATGLALDKAEPARPAGGRRLAAWLDDDTANPETFVPETPLPTGNEQRARNSGDASMGQGVAAVHASAAPRLTTSGARVAEPELWRIER